MFGIGNLFNFGLLFIRCDMSIRNTFYFGLAFFLSWSNIAWFKINILTWQLEIEPYRRGAMNKRGIILNIYVYLLTLLGLEKWFRLFITLSFVAELFIFLPYGTYDDESTCGFHPCFFSLRVYSSREKNLDLHSAQDNVTPSRDLLADYVSILSFPWTLECKLVRV